MCGISGIANFHQSVLEREKNLINSLSKLSHRGPDFCGTFLSTHVILGHRRLSIIDTSYQANQPLSDSTSKYKIIFNGEIYNFKELRKKLEKKGYIFKTNSDTEVLLNLYIDEGKKCLESINGDFAFAIFDENQNSLFLARDRFGVKPLYYTYHNNTLYFSSELKGLLPLLEFVPSISDEALLYYLQLNYIPAPFSIFQNVYKLKPGNYIFYNSRNLEVNSYYSIPQNTLNEIEETEAINTVRKFLIQAVEKRLVSDVPIGCFLSGGIDSSIVSAIAKQFKSDLNTFTISFNQDSYFDESKDAEIVAKHLQTKHHTIPIEEKKLIELIPSILEHIDEPFADSSSIAMSALAKYTRNYITVALSGDGADELLGGYYKHTAHYWAFKLYPLRYAGFPLLFATNLLPNSRNNSFHNKVRQVKKFLEGLYLNNNQRYWYWATTMKKNVLFSLVNKKISLPDYSDLLPTNSNSINQILLNDLHLVLPNDMLYKTDSMTMMHSLEARVPMLDHEFVNYIVSLPPSYKIKFNQRKIILKKAFAHLLPKSILLKPKHGFEVPLHKWIRGPLKPYLISLTEKKLIEKQNLFNYQHIQKLIFKNQSFYPSDSAVHLWNLIVFQHWWKKIYS